MNKQIARPVSAAENFAYIREEMRFEIALLHDRVNALIGAEAFLTIAFTAAMSNSNPECGDSFAIVVAPVLSFLGLLLAMLAWPGIDASFRIIVAWNAQQNLRMKENPDLVCQTVFKTDPGSASNFDPLGVRRLGRSNRIEAGGEEEIGPASADLRA